MHNLSVFTEENRNYCLIIDYQHTEYNRVPADWLKLNQTLGLTSSHHLKRMIEIHGRNRMGFDTEKKKPQQNESPEEARKPGKEKRLASFYYIKALQ